MIIIIFHMVEKMVDHKKYQNNMMIMNIMEDLHILIQEMIIK